MTGATRRSLPRPVRWALDVQRRYTAIGGQTLAAGVTLYGFLALFALLVLAVAVLGFVSVNQHDLPRQIAHDLGLTGDAARIITRGVRAARRSRQVTTIAGAAGLVWLGTTWAVSIANAYNAAWGVDGRGLRDRPRGLLWLLGAFVLIAAASGASAGFALLPALLAPVVVIVSLLVNGGLWLWTSWVLPNRTVPVRALLVPAALGAIALEVLKVLGGYVVPHYITRSSELYGAIGAVFAVLLWLLVFGRVVVYLAVVESLTGRSWALSAGRGDPSGRGLTAGGAP